MEMAESIMKHSGCTVKLVHSAWQSRLGEGSCSVSLRLGRMLEALGVWLDNQDGGARGASRQCPHPAFVQPQHFYYEQTNFLQHAYGQVMRLEIW